MAYEEFCHPNYSSLLEKVDNYIDAYRARVEAYIKPDGQHLSAETIDAICDRKRTLLMSKVSRIANKERYIFVELPIAVLDIYVPVSLPWAARRDEDGNVIRRTFRDYLVFFYVSTDGTKVIFPLAGKPINSCRPDGVTDEEIDAWRAVLDSRGFNWTNALNTMQYRARLESVEYSASEDI